MTCVGRVRWSGSLLALAFVTLWCEGPASAHQFERTAECAQGGSSTIEYGARTQTFDAPYQCRLVAGAIDTYTFEGVAGDNVRVFLVKLGFQYEALLEVWAPSKQRLVSSQACEGAPGICTDAQSITPLPETGAYEVRIPSTEAGDDFDYYRLRLERVAPATFDPADIDAQSGSGSYSDANAIDPGADIDHFGIELTDPGPHRIEFRLEALEGLAGGFDPRVEIWNPAGEPVAEASCDGGGRFDDPCATQVEVEIEGPGIYSFAISDVGSDEAGDYLYAWSLPEPAAALQAAAVLGALGGLCRLRRQGGSDDSGWRQ